MVSKTPAYLLPLIIEQRRLNAAERRLSGKVWVYVIHWQARGPTKVGVAGDPPQRRSELQGGNPYPLTIFTAFGFAGPELAYEMEAATLARLKACRMAGEWLDATPLQVRDAIQECATKRGLRPSTWEEPKPIVIDKKRARKAMEEYRRLRTL